MTEPRRPLHLAWLVGLSASIYAANLAAVTAMQAQTDATVAAQQVPAQAALDTLRAHDAAVSAAIDQAAASLKSGAAQYAQAGKALAALEQRLSGLGKSAGSLKALPAVPTGGSSVVAAPVIHSTTGASGAKP